MALWLITIVGIGLLAAVLLLCSATIGLSIRYQREAVQNARARTAVRTELLERLQQEEPDWDTWIDSLSPVERTQLESVLDRYLRTFKGDTRKTYYRLAAQLGIGTRANELLESDDYYLRLEALAWLTLLDYPISSARLLETCSDTRKTREAGARLLFERRQEFESPEAVGTELVIWDGTMPISIYGMDTLASLNEGSETPLLERAANHASEWRQSVLIEVCTVVQYCRMIGSTDPFEWLLPLLENDEPAIRMAAITACKQQGWREELRSQIDFRSLVTDEDSRVRTATYEVLTYWGDARARELLEWAVIDEDDRRAQMTAVRGLASLDADPTHDQPGWPAETWEWVRAEIEINHRRRLPIAAPDQKRKVSQ